MKSDSSHCTSIVSKSALSNKSSITNSSMNSSISSCESYESSESGCSSASSDWMGFKVLHPLEILLKENATTPHEEMIVKKKEKVD